MPMRGRVLLTGATGFVGEHLYPQLMRDGWQVRCATRKPQAAAARAPEREWVELDVGDLATVDAALAGCTHAVYLIHSMAEAGDFEHRERKGAENFARAAGTNSLQRIVYLGGVVPHGPPSKHLRSRHATGEILRSGVTRCVELQAAMVIGNGSESWQLVRDIVSLPIVALPKWAGGRSQPVAVADVVAALAFALEFEADRSGVWELPGPEILSCHEMLARVARLAQTSPLFVDAPFLSTSVASAWLDVVTRADTRVARELIEGLRYDLIVDGDGFWSQMPSHCRLGFDQAVSQVLAQECHPPPRLGDIAIAKWRQRIWNAAPPRLHRQLRALSHIVSKQSPKWWR